MLSNLDKKNFNHYFENSKFWESYLKVESKMAQVQAKVGIIPKKASDLGLKHSKIIRKRLLKPDLNVRT